MAAQVNVSERVFVCLMRQLSIFFLDFTLLFLDTIVPSFVLK